ncbi:MAG: tetrahydromethanopterin S-methyltransferase subunit A [Candidatus Methanoperedens nitroreducens]|uniref:Tetrahydromethanopterin S-methyltransferase subunit A n=1 Tax=Candidatus Methanoperedens nitratireducens TaxID=1392998 RepID=A0A0P7ZH48_9EURY|nr:tetrahydromethanopterin S-methyltransferase subunit A [Candidatus Methanoperedens sp. BLZ2]KAB2946969.1 MAG: tetrahydromethanopterin S-methyltransferase subunit A [Candidatus Methanoperedens sp.]KPQ44272.1 MAG: tetrahydromethanopterin S-methyltransferase subunit A [Candidatus Methanoperedens sp. BLZ1]MBZ0176770.1 tetrahydromethanopterin S-methyltransferase subunit A [Candidatus Methanoperedens nitroreducens]MCX9080492.1 tetrahydromethanopterin S-methyltransferase subunit A [Candidatus Methan
MVNKVKPAEGWPVIKGEYEVGNPENPVAVSTCGSHVKGASQLTAGAAITGPQKTENLGIEKIVANVISNPNIRFLLVTGAEVKGHISGEAMVMFHKNGIRDNRVVGATGAIPYIENLPDEAVKRFQTQVVEVVNMIGIEDEDAIVAKVKELAAKDPGALSTEPAIIPELETEEDAEEDVEIAVHIPRRTRPAILAC